MDKNLSMSIDKIFSKKKKNKLLHIIYKPKGCSPQRINIVPEEEFLQLSCLNLNKENKFKAHEHIFKPGEETVIAQESWVVIRGKIKFLAFDLDGELLEEHILESGDCSITLYGGHNYEILQDNTLIYEYKTGPYKGQSMDKKFI